MAAPTAPEYGDGLSPARGCLLGVALSAVWWATGVALWLAWGRRFVVAWVAGTVLGALLVLCWRPRRWR